MSGAAHAFKDSLRVGNDWASRLDEHFATRFAITPASIDEERRGIDRWFTPVRGPSMVLSVEYKADVMAGKTGNAFIETVSSDVHGRPGWGYTCTADRLVFLVPDGGALLVVRSDAIRAELRGWLSCFRVKCAKNDTYFSYGVCVPLATFWALGREERLS